MDETEQNLFSAIKRLLPNHGLFFTGLHVTKTAVKLFAEINPQLCDHSKPAVRYTITIRTGLAPKKKPLPE